MQLPPGTRVGPYEIVSPIGAGGMGEVYRARDSHLNRQVAIKVLPELFALDADRLARFTREAQALAALNHPNIAQIYGFEQGATTRALAMELVEGDDLSVLIARGAIPVADALPIARQIVEALEAAHEAGIIHRDLKPANVKVRPDGTVKVLDFGLAKAIDPAVTSGAAAMHSPTLTARATQLGVIVGTAAYMAPEQAKGKAVDKRADIWAFGVVLYEMLTGTRAFGGEDSSEVLAAVLRDGIDWSRLPANAPVPLRVLLERCLERDPRKRLRDIGEARVEIAALEAGPLVTAPPPASAARSGLSTRELLAWCVAMVAVAGAVAVAYVRSGTVATERPQTVRLPFVAPANVDPTELANTLVSPDGQFLLFSARSADGRKHLWIRRLDSMTAEPLPDTDDAIEPFWSGDSRSVAFGAQGKLKRVDLGGARAQVLTDAARLVGGAWSPSGDTIVFAPDYRSPLYRVAAGGGPRQVATRIDPEKSNGHRYPSFLPDGRRFLYWSGRAEGNASIEVGSVDAADSVELLPDFAPAIYSRSGHLLYLRNGSLVAQVFDAARLELSGEPVGIAPGMTLAYGNAGGRFSVSDNGVLAVQGAPSYDYQLTWFDRAGNKGGSVGPVLKVTVPQLPRISPQGTRVLVQRFDPQLQNQDLWIGDLARGTFDRFTTSPAMEQLAFWSRDGLSVICSTVRSGVAGIHQLFPSGDERMLVPGTVFPSDMAPDGTRLLYLQRGEKTRSDIWTVPLSGAGSTAAAGTPSLLVSSEADEQHPHVSPDGKWIAYISDITGLSEIYVRPLAPEGKVGEAVRVSSGGGVQPGWSRDGRELFYVSAPQGYYRARMMAVPIRTAGDRFEAGAAVPLFNVQMLPTQTIARDYDTSIDSQRFLIGTATHDATTPSVTVVLNGPRV